MGDPAICPHCGYDLRGEEVIEDGPFRFEPRRGLFYSGEHVHLGPSRTLIVGALIRASGAVLTESALLGVVGSDDLGSNLLGVHLCHIRRTLAERGAPCPVQTIRGVGYRWDSAGNHPGVWAKHVRASQSVVAAA